VKKNTSRALIGLAVPLVLAARSIAPTGGDSTSYKFEKPPVNSMGVQSMADLRGKPVLIDFWGTR
jgi:hypothetical protein